MTDYLNFDFEYSYEPEPEVHLVQEFVDEGFHIRKLLPQWQEKWDKHSGAFEKGRLYSLMEIEGVLRERGLKKVVVQLAMRQFWRRGFVERFRERKKANWGKWEMEVNGRVYYKFKGD